MLGVEAPIWAVLRMHRRCSECPCTASREAARPLSTLCRPRHKALHRHSLVSAYLVVGDLENKLSVHVPVLDEVPRVLGIADEELSNSAHARTPHATRTIGVTRVPGSQGGSREPATARRQCVADAARADVGGRNAAVRASPRQPPHQRVQRTRRSLGEAAPAAQPP